MSGAGGARGGSGRAPAVREVDFLLVGGGFASGPCAPERRGRGADGSIVLVGREQDPPYERPPLSKEYLRGESGRSDAYVHPPEWYEENDVELLAGTSVMSLDAGARIVKLQSGEEVRFGKALLGTGARVNILHHLEGAQLEGIHYLRTLGNSDAIRAEAADTGRVVLIGGSYIGSEVAASLTANGVDCTMLMLEDVAMSRAFGEDVGRYFHDILASHGIEIHGGEELDAFIGDGRVRAVRTKSGREIECGAVVIGAGGTSLEYVGPAAGWDEIIWRGDRDAGEFAAFYLAGARVAAALSVGRSEDLSHARRFIEEGVEVGERKGELADADSDLEAI